MGSEHVQNQFAVVVHANLPVQADKVAVHCVDGQTHVARDHGFALRVKEVLNDLKLARREVESIRKKIPVLIADQALACGSIGGLIRWGFSGVA